jgi:hypothetical protein
LAAFLRCPFLQVDLIQLLGTGIIRAYHLFQLRVITGNQQDRRPPRVEDKQDADLAPPAEAGPELLEIRNLRVGDGVDERAAKCRSRPAQRVDGVINQVGGLRVAVLEFRLQLTAFERATPAPVIKVRITVARAE